MARILDTGILISWWRQYAQHEYDDVMIRASAQKLLELHRAAGIVTPVRIEFVVGARSGDELKRYLVFLDVFPVIDKGFVPSSIWQDAERVGARIPRNQSPRQFGDCVIRALANHLRVDVITPDANFPS